MPSSTSRICCRASVRVSEGTIRRSKQTTAASGTELTFSPARKTVNAREGARASGGMTRSSLRFSNFGVIVLTARCMNEQAW